MRENPKINKQREIPKTPEQSISILTEKIRGLEALFREKGDVQSGMDDLVISIITIQKNSDIDTKRLKSLSNKFKKLGSFLIKEPYKEDQQLKNRFKILVKEIAEGNFSSVPTPQQRELKILPTKTKKILSALPKEKIKETYQLSKELEKHKSEKDYAIGKAAQYSTYDFITMFGSVKFESSKGRNDSKIKYFIEQEIVDPLLTNEDLTQESLKLKRSYQRGDNAEAYFVSYPGSDVARNSDLYDKVLINLSAPKHSEFDTEEKVDILTIIDNNYTDSEKYMIQEFYSKLAQVVSGKLSSGFDIYNKDISSIDTLPGEYIDIIELLREAAEKIEKTHQQIRERVNQHKNVAYKRFPNLINNPLELSKKYVPSFDPQLTALMVLEQKQLEQLEDINELFLDFLAKDVEFKGFQVKNSQKGLEEHIYKSDVGVITPPTKSERALADQFGNDSKTGELVTKRYSIITSAYENLLDL